MTIKLTQNESIMETQTLLIIVELLGNLTITVGIIIAVIQVKQIKKQRKEMAVFEFFSSWQTPEFTKALNEIQLMPDHVGLKELRSSKPEMDSYAYLVHSFFESTGLMVKRQIISFDIVNDLVGGVIQVTWKKLDIFIEEWRNERNPLAGEWFEWLKTEIENKSKLSK
jgi:hypothetical protein